MRDDVIELFRDIIHMYDLDIDDDGFKSLVEKAILYLESRKDDE